MVKFFIVALCVFIASACWLYMAVTSGNTTKQWPAVEAEIGTAQSDRNLVGRKTGVLTPVRYEIDGVQYEAFVDDFLIAGAGTVYVNPEDPTDVVGLQGPAIQNFGRPLIITIASGLFLIVLGLIAFSPKED